MSVDEPSLHLDGRTDAGRPGKEIAPLVPPDKKPPRAAARQASRRKPAADQVDHTAEPGDADVETPGDDADEPAPGEEPAASGKLAAFLRGASSWLVSMLVHLVGLLLLAVMTFALPDEPNGRFITAAPSDDDAALDEVAFEDPPVDLQQMAISDVRMNDPGVIEFGEITSAMEEAAPKSEGLGEPDDMPIGEIAAPYGSRGQGMTTVGDGTGGAEFFGVKAGGRVFVFVVDSSMSMKAGKFDDARRELLAAVQRLSEDQLFYVIFFDWDAYRMFDLDHPEPRPIPATRENVYRLRNWMATVQLELKTNPYEAVRYALKMLPDAIYILSDGKFTDRGKTVQYLAKNNKVDDPLLESNSKVVIHTIGFYTNDDGTLQRMAKEHGGTYRFVPKPPNRKGPKANRPGKRRPGNRRPGNMRPGNVGPRKKR